MKHFNKFLAVLVLGIMLLLITACGSSSSGPATSSMVVTPSLGEVTDETFAMYQIDGTLVSTTFVIQPDGTIVVNYPTTITGPIYIEISGNATATYFDEVRHKQIYLNRNLLWA